LHKLYSKGEDCIKNRHFNVISWEYSGFGQNSKFPPDSNCVHNWKNTK